jgi:hypothetical protein
MSFFLSRFPDQSQGLFRLGYHTTARTRNHLQSEEGESFLTLSFNFPVFPFTVEQGLLRCWGSPEDPSGGINIPS